MRGVKAGRRLIGEMDLVISTYCMEWIKINSNLILNPGWDLLYEYTNVWHEVLAEVRRLHPETCFECCPSGAMRMDFNNISRYGTMFNTPIRQIFPQVESRDAYMSGKELMEQGGMAQLAFPESAAVFCIDEV